MTLGKDTSIPDKDITSSVHLDTVETETDLWGLFIPNKSCFLFHLSLLVICADILLKIELHKDQCLSQTQKFEILELLYLFPKFSDILQN